MVIEWILAFAFLAEVNTSAPQQLAPMESRSACMAEADKRNRNDERLRAPEVRAKGGRIRLPPDRSSHHLTAS